jgi:hypothetical protein
MWRDYVAAHITETCGSASHVAGANMAVVGMVTDTAIQQLTIATDNMFCIV